MVKSTKIVLQMGALGGVTVCAVALMSMPPWLYVALAYLNAAVCMVGTVRVIRAQREES